MSDTIKARQYIVIGSNKWDAIRQLRWPKRSLAERFWQKVDRCKPLDCWEWQAYRYPSGYGHFQIRKGKWEYAHRLAYRLAVGPLGKLHVLHSCDNPPCCNPKHLRLGTHQENMQDRVSRDTPLKTQARHSKTHPTRSKEALS